MTARLLPPAAGKKLDPVTAFRARCEARAHLYGAGEIPDLHEAVDVLQADAAEVGLVEAMGQDAVQAILAEAFRPVRQREWQAERAEQGDTPPLVDEPARAGIPQATIEALMYGFRRGLSCLADLGHRDRLQRCDQRAIREIVARLLQWDSQNKTWLPAWTKDDVTKLLHIWRGLTCR